MNTKLNNIIGFGLCLAAALALVTGTATNALADEVKTAKGGASELLKLKPIKTASDIDALKEGDSVVMSCPKCKTVTVTRITRENKPGQIRAVPTSEHLCPGCDNKVTVTEWPGLNRWRYTGPAMNSRIRAICLAHGFTRFASQFFRVLWQTRRRRAQIT